MQLTFHPVGGYLSVALVAAMLLVLLARVAPRHIELPFGKRLALKLLRLAAIFMLLLAMLRPTLQYTRTSPEEATLLVLVDRSRSMQVADSLDNRSRYEAAQFFLRQAEDDLRAIEQKSWTTRAYSFAESVEPVAVEAGTLKLPAEATGDQSPLGAALEELLIREGDERLRGVLVLSDGAQRAVPPLDTAPQLVARQYAAEGIPLYTFYFGQPGGSDRADLAVEDLLVSGTVFAGAPTRVSGQLHAVGYANRSAKVQLLWEKQADDEREMEVVNTTQQSIVTADSRTPVSLAYTPTTPGEYKVTLRAESPEGELVTTNNEASTFVTVREGGIKVLYLYGATRIGGGAGVEQAFVPRTIDESPDVVVSRKLFNYTQPPEDFRRELAPGSYDVVILADVDKDAMSPESWQAMAEMVRRGSGLMMTGGYHSFGPGGFRNTPLADVLPVTIGPAERQSFRDDLRQDVHVAGPLAMQPAGDIGRTHPIMQIVPGGSPGAGWDQLPPLDGANRLDRRLLKPNAQVLAESGDSGHHPLLVAGQVGNGRTLAFAGDSTWRWQIEGHGDEFRRFWRQVILWLARKDDNPAGRVWIDLATRRVSRGGRLDIEVGGTPDDDAPADTQLEFEVSITLPDGTQQPLATVASEANRRVGTLATTDQPGDYLAQVTAKVGGREVGTAKARFLVPTEDLELDRPGAEPTLLAGLAKQTESAGGQAFAPEELPALVRRLAAEEPELQTEVIERVTYWDKWPFFLVFVGLVGVEWFLRKRWGLV